MEKITIVYICIFLLALATLYDQITKRIPTRLRADQAPKLGYGLLPAVENDLPVRAHGIDIVFIHGLGSNPDTTWQARRLADTPDTSPGCSANSNQDVNWVSEFLPDDLPPTTRKDTRLYFYNYDSYWKRDAVRTRLWDLGEQLLEHIKTGIRRSEEERSRNLIFVGYSYGGLVIKQALVRAHINHDRDFVEHTKAILFLGTPHRGSNFTKLARLVAQALRPLGSNPLLLAELEYDSTFLQDLHKSFVELVQNDLRAINFFELRRTQIFRLWFLRWEEFCVPPQSAKYDNAKSFGLSVDHSGLNKFGSKDESYRMIASKLVEIATSLCGVFKHRYAVPLETLSTYTQRYKLSKLLEEKIRVNHENASVPRAVVIHGLGGTGKSQLALKYAEDHKDQYDPVLWIDATDAEAVRSSFEACAAELGIVVDSAETKGSALTNSKAVQAVLKWLRNRKETDDDWLVIIDNADDVSWGLKNIIPKGKQGSIVITSRDNLSPMLVGGGCEQLEVSVMSALEANTLLLRRLQWDVESAPEKIRESCSAIVRQLGCLALAVDLVGAYIGNEIDQEAALMQYVADYDRHRDELLQDDRLRGLLPTEKTVWTVWDTTLKKLEKDHARFQPTLLLAFLARFKGTIIQDEMFRLASLGIATVNHELGEEEERLPSEIREFLQLSGAEWDSFLYRQGRDLLLRYSLVQRVDGEWPGMTMHSLVQWRAMQYEKSKRWDWWYLIFVLAACCQITDEHHRSQFRWHLVGHVPEVTKDRFDGIKVGEKTRLFIERTVSRVHYARQEELFQIHKILAGANGRRIVVLHGLGGIGKTQLAATYAKYHRADYSDIFWLNLKDENSAKQSYARIAGQILQAHPSASQLSAIIAEGDINERVMAAKRWLNHPQNTQWLIICDDYDNPKFQGNPDPAAVDIHRFLPDVYHGSIIIITRSSRVDIGSCIHVRELRDIRDSLQILSDASRREGVMDDPAAAELAKQLVGLPLALAAAGAYIHREGINFAEYLRLFEASWLRLQQRSAEVGSYESRAPHSTWQLAFEHIKHQNELSAQLLQLWAYFDNQDLWFELLQECRSGGPEWLSQLTEDEFSFNQAMRTLQDHGLAEVEKSSEGGRIESRGYSINGNVHLWTMHVLNNGWDTEMVGLAIDCVASHVPGRDNPNSWAIQRRLLRHAARCWSFVVNGMVDEDSRAWALHCLGYLYAEQGKHDQAEELYRRALRSKKRVLGPEHISTLDTANNLGLLYADLGRFDEAEKLYERALLGKEKVLGPEHISTLNTINNVGLLYQRLGKLDEAEKVYQRALQGYEKAVGHEAVETFVPALDTFGNLAALYAQRGKDSMSEELYSRTLHGIEIVFGQGSGRYRRIAAALDALRSSN